VEREDSSTSKTLFESGSSTFTRDIGGCAAKSKVYSRELFGSATPFTSKEVRSGSVRLAAGSPRTLVNSKAGAIPSHVRRQNFALVGGNSTRFSTSDWPLARRFAIGAAATRERQAAKSSLASKLKRPVYSVAVSGQPSCKAERVASSERASRRYCPTAVFARVPFWVCRFTAEPAELMVRCTPSIRIRVPSCRGNMATAMGVL